jgi:2-oxo-3-hexenedioate decarboxylase
MAAAPDRLAERLLLARDEGRQLVPLSSTEDRLNLIDAYRLTATLRALREIRGERAIGRKIGFTNRNIWRQYNVYAPIWGYIYDTTVYDLPDTIAASRLAWTLEPRIEPEIVFGFAETPAPGMDERALLGCIAWLAHGFEIVESLFPGWVFEAPDTVAGFGLHRALFIGPRHSVRTSAESWLAALSSFEIELLCNGGVAACGHARNVLNGPLQTLRHLMNILQSDPSNPPLAAGEIVTTGTLTDAMPISLGQRWSTALKGIGLDGASLDFT